MNTTRSISTIASEIRKDWKNIPACASAYLKPMFQLDKITDNYYSDDAKSILLYFLSNTNTWKGETAKKIKNEIRVMCGLKPRK